MNALLARLVKWIPQNLTAILGIIQAVIKFVKEVCTLIVDILGPIIPGDGVENIVKIVRDVCNAIDEWVERIKDFLLSIGG